MAEAGDGGGWRAKLKRSIRQIGPVRLAITFVFLAAGLYAARFNWDVPLSSDAERVLYDLRFQAKAERLLEQDNRIVLVTYNDETLRQLGKRSPLDRRMLARALRAIDRMGPRAIGIDILFDQPQAEDPELIQTFRAMRTPTYLAFATNAQNPEQMEYWQEQFLRNFLRQVASGPVRPASIKLEADGEDGVIRRWTRQDGSLPPLLANAMARVHPEFRDYRGGVDFRLPASAEVARFTNLPIELFAQLELGEMGRRSGARSRKGFVK